MSDFILSCCSTADMPKSFFEERNVAYVCFHFNMDGKDYPDDLGESMPFPEFYKRTLLLFARKRHNKAV